MSAAALAGLMPAGTIAGERERAAWSWLGAAPEAVVRPESTEEVAALLAWASGEGVGVVPVGSGLHVGAMRTDAPFVVLSTERLGGIERYEPADLTFTARAGTPLRELDAALAEQAQWLPADPPHRPERTLGGLVASGLTGPLAAGYGEVRNHVLGMTVVLGDGRVLRLGGGVVKNVAGFDLLKPMIGSRGTLGVVTSVCVRTFPLPAAELVLALRADGPEEVVDAARAVRTAPVVPASAVLIAPAAELGAASALVVRLHGATTTAEADRKTLEARLGRSFEVLPAERREDLRAWARDHASDAPVVLGMSVLPSRLEEVLEAAGPWGADGPRLHADVYRGRFRVGLHTGDEASLEARVRALRGAVEGTGGTLRVERAPGGLDAGALSSQPSDEERLLAAGLARAFDPAGVLWRRRAREAAG